MKALPSVQRLNEVLHYDEHTGVFTWKVTLSNRAMKGDKAGSVYGRGYVHIKIDNVRYKAHRLAIKIKTGQDPHSEVDHINNNRVDNRWCNLRVVSHQDNQRNRKDTKANGTFEYNYYIKHKLPVPESVRLAHNKRMNRYYHNKCNQSTL